MYSKKIISLSVMFFGLFGAISAEGIADGIKGEEPASYVTFLPPKGWRSVNSKDLPKSVKFMVVGQGSQAFPPSINLGTESYSGTLKEYLNMIKEINASQGAEWKDLGKMDVACGQASLSQVDAETEWGKIRMMHVILVKSNTAYILTSAALKEEFPKFYKDFFSSMRSLNFVKDPKDVASTMDKKKELANMQKNLECHWSAFAEKNKTDLTEKPARKALFESAEFQNEAWLPFEKKITQGFVSYGEDWQEGYIDEMKNRFLQP